MSEVKKMLRDFVSISKASTHEAIVLNLHNLVCCLAGESIVSASTMSNGAKWNMMFTNYNSIISNMYLCNDISQHFDGISLFEQVDSKVFKWPLCFLEQFVLCQSYLLCRAHIALRRHKFL